MPTELPLVSTTSSSCCSPSSEQNGNALSSCCSASEAAPEQLAVEANSTVLLVDGMTCGHCVSSVTEELTELDGVDTVAVELIPGGTSQVTVALNSPVTEDAFRAAVQAAGYELTAR